MDIETLGKVKIQSTDKVAYLGGKYTFSHIAAAKYFGLDIECEERLRAFKPMEEVVNAVQSGSVMYGVIPFWNTSKHSIIEAQEKIINSSDVYIVDNFKMDVNLCLLSPERSIQGVRSIETIKHVMKQASTWKSSTPQLQELITKNVKSTVDSIDSAMGERKAATICSPLAANRYSEKYGYNILCKNIENEGNATLFFVIKRGIDWDKLESLYHTILAFPLEEGYRTKTIVKLSIIDNSVYCSQRWPVKFAGGRVWHVLEIDGHPNDFEVKGFIEDLREYLPESRILGIYTKGINETLTDKSLFDSR